MRFFTALDIAPEQRRQIAELRSNLPGATWTPVENYHLTLRFLGEIRSRAMAEEIDFALMRIESKPFTLHLGGTGIFHTPRGDKLWIGVQPNDTLTLLQARIESAMRRIGLPPEKRRFQPHISIAHMEAGADAMAARWMQVHNLLHLEPMPVDRFTLFQSHLSSDAPVYENCAEYLLDRRFAAVI
ncbi:RNA 2',3'-cyclic phosphodiesterase [Kozakia baliensis]|uniref:RNA 2',3'-cyclic phosphodiesterase n=1 Tax=Kozakia baliensis TaxID=153496 RepID=UPI00345C2250